MTPAVVAFLRMPSCSLLTVVAYGVLIAAVFGMVVALSESSVIFLLLKMGP